MNKKGFSLIGLIILVALVVGLVIGFLIYTGKTENAKIENKVNEGVYKSTVYGYIDVIEYQAATNELTQKYPEITDGEYSVSELASLGVSPKGYKPVKGSVTVKDKNCYLRSVNFDGNIGDLGNVNTASNRWTARGDTETEVRFMNGTIHT